jgi:hypothetical protein
MNWVRIACDIEDDPKVRSLARALGISLQSAVGCIVMVLARMPKHARDGVVAHLDLDVLEDWTGWAGQPGAFARAFAERFVKDGVVTGWEKHNGAAIREADRRAKVQRDRRAKATAKRQAERERQEAEHTDPTKPKRQRRKTAPHNVLAAGAVEPAHVPDAVPGYAPGHDTPGVFTNGTGRDVPDLGNTRSGDGPSPGGNAPVDDDAQARAQRRALAMAGFRAEASSPAPSRPLARLVAIA